MEEKNLKSIRRSILNAIKKKDYQISIEEPGNIEVRTRDDGSQYIVVFDGDGPCSSTGFGSCTLTIAGYEFTNKFEYGEWECDEEELLDDEQIMDAIESIDDVICGDFTEMDDQVRLYNMINGANITECYWYEDMPGDNDDE